MSTSIIRFSPSEFFLLEKLSEYRFSCQSEKKIVLDTSQVDYQKKKKERRNVTSKKQKNYHKEMAEDDENKESGGLGLDSSFKIDFYIHTYSKKRGRQDEKREVFLENIEGHVEPGTVCAVIGPRDSGKDRLLQLLSGRTNKHVCLGEVHVNGTRLAAPQMRAMTAYLRNAGSSLIGQTTVEESVDFTARLVLPSNVDDASRKTKVERVLEEVQLTNVKHCRIDGGVKNEPISAEDRVRVGLAQVLVENKKMIFLDELTEGLDLLSAERVVRDIISLAEVKLLTVFVTLEHPTKLLLEKFQKCLFLSKGHQLYFGRVRNSVDFFTRLGYPIPEETSIYDHILGLTVPDA
ncbi:ABC transporter, partial [Reticulomyxa filosa]